jgi:hypothetical protein
VGGRTTLFHPPCLGVARRGITPRGGLVPCVRARLGHPHHLVVGLVHGVRSSCQLESWTGAQAGCWLAMQPGTVPLGIQAMLPGQPAYVGALRFIRALGFDSNDPSVIVGQVPLASALSLVTGQVTATMQPLFKDGMAGVVNVTITLTKDGVTGIKIPGTAILKTLKRAATKVPAEVSTYLEGDTETLEFPEADAPEPIKEPAKDLVYFADRDGCVAASQ